MVKFIFLALLLFPLSACGQGEEGGGASPDINQLSIVTADGREVDFEVELAITEEQKATGLMNRLEMPENAGMLFYFKQEQEVRFWMKNTLIPLDMIFIKVDGTIHHIHENAVPLDLTGVPSNGVVSAVLEINGGLSEKLRLSVGDKVKHRVFDGKITE